ncbi:MAG TPA: cytochrome c-type biogenesis CcmF C-terminal domain-containing protein [Vicinamibacteria bacterium]|nr:cytochrome c-type biogenesis CcmF C-terminal domain-containing protein [Vicinamibacteria bacterium]
MTPALGRALILLALLVSAAGAVLAFAVGRRPTPAGARWAERFAYAFAALMVAANLVMVYALLTHDFSVSYVAQVGSRSLPTWVTVVSLWSSLEGSILFWGLVLGLYVAAATWATRERHPEYAPWAIGTWLACGTFFSFLIAGPAQPFLTVPTPPPDGPGPNPLLQNHILMAVHPPFLYLGYVGMTIPFGLAAAALLSGRLGPDFLRALRIWLLLPWTFLSVAIVLGGWWAYEVLGWGGYWAWDPVENASFLPWLTATAALHSALLLERKGSLKGWTITLVMATFLLTILGTFMTRSGVFNSVHSFTQSEIGPTILVFLTAALLFSVALLALRVDRLGASSGTFAPKSREAMFLVNNLLFVLFTFTVLIGTVFPLIVEATQGVQMSVGRPYFDRMAVPIGVALLFLMGVGPALPWGRATAAEARRALLPPLAGAAVAGALAFALGVRPAWTLATIALAGYTAQVTVREMARPLRRRMAAQGEALTRALEGQLREGRRRLAGYVVHGAVVVIVVAIAVSSTLGHSREVQLGRGDSVELAGYTLTFLGAEPVAEPHRQSLVARVAVERGGRSLGVLAPAMNYYPNQREPVGTPAVRSSWREDLYLSMVNVDPARQTLGLHAIVKPMVAWIWGATAVLGLAALAGLLPARRREEPAAATAPAARPAAASTR